jgi:arsenical pump membrane protein
VDSLLAGCVLLLTLLLILIRPWNLNEAWWAGLGGLATLGLGLASPPQAWGILRDTWDAILLLIGMMALSVVAERAGFFDRVAALAIRAGGGSVPRLYGMVFLVGTLITATLSLDATAIVLTPIVYGTVVRLRLSPLPFMFACLYTANTASLFLPVSNLTNLLVYNAFDLGFARFALIMLLPATLAVAANAAVFAVLFRSDLRGSYEAKLHAQVPADGRFLRLVTIGIVGVLAAFFVSPLVGAPIGVVALAGGAVVVAGARMGGWMRLREAAGSVAWGIVVLVVGLFLVVQGVENAGLAAALREGFVFVGGESLPRILGVAAGAAVGSNLINNVPMTIMAIRAMDGLFAGGALQPGVAYATLVGTNIGPNLTVVGSLATLIWLNIVRGRGLEVGAKEFLRVGAISTPVILTSAVLGLWVSLHLFAT